MNLFENLYDIVKESIELKAPVGGYKKHFRSLEYDDFVYQYIFDTSKGNEVVLNFYNQDEKDRERSYHIVVIDFLVNGRVGVENARLANPSSYSGRDAEILSGVVYLILQYIKEHESGIDIIKISAVKDDEGSVVNKRLGIYKRLLGRYVSRRWEMVVHGDDIILQKRGW